MRALLVSALASFALSCGSLHPLGTGGPLDSGTHDSGTTDTGTTHTGTHHTDTGTIDTGHQDSGLQEDCKTPGDEDGNGLADCEDPACFTDDACVELVCNDGQDNDGDGWTDCDDEDCWGNGCAATVAAVNGGGELFGSEFVAPVYEVCYSGSAYGYFSGSYVAAKSVSGLVYTVSANGGSDWHVCGFQVPAAYALARRLSGSTTYDAVYRPAVYVSGSCNVVDSGFLPQRFRIAWPNVVALDTPYYNPTWYRPSSSYVSGSTSNYGTSYTSSGSCTLLWSSAAIGFDASSIQFGNSVFFTAHP